jgi:hypothetical protein
MNVRYRRVQVHAAMLVTPSATVCDRASEDWLTQRLCLSADNSDWVCLSAQLTVGRPAYHGRPCETRSMTPNRPRRRMSATLYGHKHLLEDAGCRET